MTIFGISRNILKPYCLSFFVHVNSPFRFDMEFVKIKIFLPINMFVELCLSFPCIFQVIHLEQSFAGYVS